MNAPVLEFALGEKGDDIVKRSNLTIHKSGVSSVLFYDASNVRYQLKHPTLGLLFPGSYTVLFYDNARDDYGVDHVDMSINLPDAPLVNDTTEPQIEAYDRQVYELVMSLQNSIQAAGWQRFILLSSPRLLGRSSYLFQEGYLNEPSIADLDIHPVFLADPEYRLTWEDWRHLQRDHFVWQWQAGGMLLEVKYSRSSRNPKSLSFQRDSLDITLQTAASLTGASHPNEATRTKYRDSLHELLVTRLVKEVKARAAGLPIL
ncbi:hypothetical protein, partial [Pseudomonas agarici]